MRLPRRFGLVQWIAAALLVALAVGTIFVWRYGKLGTRQRALYYLGRAEGCSLEQALHPIDDRIGGPFERFRRQITPIATTADLTHWSTPLGDYWAPERGGLAYVLAEQFVDVYQVKSDGFGPESVVLDCGANIGAFTRTALDSGARLVVAIEPSPRNVRALRLNFADEIEQGRVIVVDKGLWHEPDSLSMYVYRNSALDSLVMDDRETKPQQVQVPLDTLDNVVSELGLQRVDYIKMDIEGAERNALRGARATIRRHRPILTIATENLPDDIRAVPAAVEAILPEYEYRSGGCRFISPTQMRPEVLFFRAHRTR